MIPIIVPFYYSYHLTDRFIQSMQLEKNEKIKLIFVQNSEDDYGAKLNGQLKDYKFDNIEISGNVTNKNLFYAESVNDAIRKNINLTIDKQEIELPENISGSTYRPMYVTDKPFDIDKFMIFNPDCFPREENWLSRMLDIWKQIDDKNIVTLGTLQYTDSNKIWHDGTTWKTDEEEKCHELDWRHNNRFIYDILTRDYHKVDGNTGTGIMIDMKKFIGLGMFNAEKYPHYSSDADFCLRATRKGYTHYSCDVTMNHQPGTSVKKD